VLLDYDPNQRTISIRSAPAPRTDYYFVREYGRRGRMRLVSAIRFLKRHDIMVDRTVIVQAPKCVFIQDEPAIVLALGRLIRATR
jgi:hypothetical protein